MPEAAQSKPVRKRELGFWTGLGICLALYHFEGPAEWLHSLLIGAPPEAQRFARPELEQVGWNFPAWDLDEALLEEVEVFASSAGWGPVAATFLVDGEGGGELLLCREDEWRTYDARGHRTGSREVRGWGGEVERFEAADGTVYLLEQRGPEARSRADEVDCRRDGEVLWSRRSRNLYWEVTVPIGLEDGRSLVLLSSKGDFLALWPNGDVAWNQSDRPRKPNRISTHPDLPGVFLGMYEKLEWHRAADAVQIGSELQLDDAYAIDAEAFPGASGERFAFVVGRRWRDGKGQGVMSVVDATGAARWVADGTQACELEVERLDVADGPPLFVVASSKGDLFVVDSEGAVLHHRTLPRAPSQDDYDDVIIRELDTGPLGPDHIGIAVTLSDWIAVYRIAR